MRLPGALDQEVLIEELSLSVGKRLATSNADYWLGRFCQGFHAREAVCCSAFGAQEQHRSIHGTLPLLDTLPNVFKRFLVRFKRGHSRSVIKSASGD
jgi:hypothetical protein